MLSLSQAEKIVNRKITKDVLVFGSSTLPDRRVVLVYDNPEYRQRLKVDSCYAVVHPGFSVVKGRTFVQNLTRDVSRYGSYSYYLENIKRLIQRLKTSDSLSLFFIDTPCFYGKGVYPPELLPSVSNLILLTDPAGRMIETHSGVANSELDLHQEKIYTFLKEIGIKEILISGEWVWWREKEERECHGCVGVVANGFKEKGFKVKGVEDCLYPTKPPNFDSELSRELYRR